MAEKFDFSKHEKDDLVLTAPLDKKKMMEILKQIEGNSEIKWGFVDNTNVLLKDLAIFKEILLCAYDRERCEVLIESLSEEQLNHLSLILISLKNIIDFDNFDKLYDSVINVKTPSEGDLKKASDLIDVFEQFEKLHLASNAMMAMNISQHYRRLSDIMFMYLRKSEYDEISKHVARYYPDEIDSLIETSKMILNLNKKKETV